MQPIDLMQGIKPAGTEELGKTGSKPASGEAFSEALAKASTEIIDHQKAAEQAVTQFSNGADGDIHETMLAMEKADISLKYMVSVRNKLIEAYKEIMQMGG